MKQPFYLISEDDIKALAEQISANIQNKLEGNFTPIVSSKTSDDEFLNIEELTKLIGLTKPTKNKVDKAKELGVKIIEEKEWLKLSRNS